MWGLLFKAYLRSPSSYYAMIISLHMLESGREPYWQGASNSKACSENVKSVQTDHLTSQFKILIALTCGLKRMYSLLFLGVVAQFYAIPAYHTYPSGWSYLPQSMGGYMRESQGNPLCYTQGTETVVTGNTPGNTQT